MTAHGFHDLEGRWYPLAECGPDCELHQIGVPYADAGVDGSGYYLTCPKCGQVCRGAGETEDDITESAASVYALHYEREHAQVTKSVDLIPPAAVDAAYDQALTRWRANCHHDAPPYEMPTQDGCAGCAVYLAAVAAFTEALKAQNAADAAEGFHPVGREAICLTCGQAFNPADESDLIHLQTTVPDGLKWGPDYTVDLPEGPERYCGGRGEMTGAWC
jgi:hypothetical protein